MALDDPSTLVSTEWLAAHMRDPDLRIIDASWYMPAENRDPKAEYDKAHIPGARFFDIDEISDARSALPHMAPSAEKFMSRMRAMGVGDGHQVVVYDAEGVFSAPRVWWLFRLMGQGSVAVLDGGMKKWIAEGRAIEDLPPVIRDRHMMVRFQNQMVKDATQVAAAAKLGTPQIVDARSPARFAGSEPEPREGLRAGRIPGSRNVFFKNLLNDDGTMKEPAALKAAFETAGVDLDKPVITSCGSGITACILSLALERIGKSDHAVYDGSWTEWGSVSSMPIETGDV
ncbi:MAG: 3-mercaptopyruvate sulfurtransferase [Planktotalea sp.]|uniref:3-mercaptopyruvate sulfurtransferase n=1 Tax=Planktotalea sp. TaxID=2029877 RepID=UPI003C740B87